MDAFTHLAAVAVPLNRVNVDTDQITPARFLKKPRDEHYPDYLFHDLRFHSDGTERDDFILNQAPFREAKILVADDNFGCGSSRESAVYALFDYGFRVVIAPSFGDIFANNAGKNGLLAVRLAADDVATIRQRLQDNPGATLTVDLASQTVTGPSPANTTYHFDIDGFTKQCLLEGLDDVQFTSALESEISAHEANHRKNLPWLYPSGA